MNNNQPSEINLNFNEIDIKEYIQLPYDDRLNRLLSKVNRCVDGDVTIIKKLGLGGLGTVYRVNAEISGKSVDIAQKVFFTGKDQHRSEDDYIELYTNWQITKYILENASSIAKDPFLCECVEKIPLLITTQEQRDILSEANSPEEQYEAAQKASELKAGIFLEIKGNQNLDDIIPSEINELTFEDKMKIFLDILKGGTILDRAGIIQRDFNCENIQINIQSNDKRPYAYLVDFGQAVHIDLIRIFNENESKKRDYCGPFFYSAPPEAFDKQEEDEHIFGDKYNAYGIGLLMFPIFYSKEGQEMIYDFKWSNDEDIILHRKYLFENIDEILDKLNQRLEKPYNKKQNSIIKSIMKKLINTNAEKRSNSEEVAREICKESGKIHEIAKENLSYSNKNNHNNHSKKHYYK